MVVEDNLSMRKALVETLKVLNYQTLEAGNGLEALQLIEQSGAGVQILPEGLISLVLSDLSMPEMDGQELFFEMKRRGHVIPVVMLTGFVVSHELDELTREGLSGWLLKPADIYQIAGLLKKVLN